MSASLPSLIFFFLLFTISKTSSHQICTKSFVSQSVDLAFKLNKTLVFLNNIKEPADDATKQRVFHGQFGVYFQSGTLELIEKWIIELERDVENVIDENHTEFLNNLEQFTRLSGLNSLLLQKLTSLAPASLRVGVSALQTSFNEAEKRLFEKCFSADGHTIARSTRGLYMKPANNFLLQCNLKTGHFPSITRRILEIYHKTYFDFNPSVTNVPLNLGWGRVKESNRPPFPFQLKYTGRKYMTYVLYRVPIHTLLLTDHFPTGAYRVQEELGNPLLPYKVNASVQSFFIENDITHYENLRIKFKSPQIEVYLDRDDSGALIVQPLRPPKPNLRMFFITPNEVLISHRDDPCKFLQVEDFENAQPRIGFSYRYPQDYSTAHAIPLWQVVGSFYFVEDLVQFK